MQGLSLALGFRCSLSVCLSALPPTKHPTKGLRFAPTEHLLLGAAEHQPGLQPSSLGTGRSPKAGKAAGRTGWGDPAGLDFTGDTSARKHPCLVLGARALPCRCCACSCNLRMARPQAGEKGQGSLCQVKLQL